MEINYEARVKNASLAKSAGVTRYILGSSCSVYGKSDTLSEIDESSAVNPLTTYARANRLAEEGILSIKSPSFTPICLRQATAFGYSPRMRFDLVLNIMTYHAWKKGVIEINGNGLQWRPLIHVDDIASALIHFAEAQPDTINYDIYNIGSPTNNIQIFDLAYLISAVIRNDVKIIHRGGNDDRSYRVSFDRVYSSGYSTTRSIAYGISEIAGALENRKVDLTIETQTLDYYRHLVTKGIAI
jgi:nucleoside-diphosphate-sugar epimerase